MKLFSIVFIVCFSITDVFGLEEESSGACQENKFELTGEAVFPKTKELVRRVWAQDIPLTKLGQTYKDIILQLTEHGSVHDNLVLTGATIYLTQYIPFLLQKPDACVFAAIINGTVSCAVDQNQSQLLDALTELQTSFAEVRNNFAITTACHGDCRLLCGDSLPYPVHKNKECYKNGLVYPVDALWNLPAIPYNAVSQKLRSIVLDLYNSNDHLDKFLAACTSFTLTESFQKALSMWNPKLIHEAIEMALSPPAKKCCDSRHKTATKSSEDNIKKAMEVISTLKKHYSSTGCQIQM